MFDVTLITVSLPLGLGTILRLSPAILEESFPDPQLARPRGGSTLGIGLNSVSAKHASIVGSAVHDILSQVR